MQNILTLAELQQRYNNGERFEFRPFYGGIYSNWANTYFVIDKVHYNCVEQYMMAQKAITFDDWNVMLRVMQSNDPRKIKQLGREIRGYVDEQWAARRVQVVYDAVYAKFTQDISMVSAILKDKGKIFIEASPVDEIWGVGLDEKSPAIQNPNNWRGTNLLGFVITAVAERIVAERQGV